MPSLRKLIAKLNDRVNRNTHEQVGLLCSWAGFIMLSLIVTDVKLLSYIHYNAYTKVATMIVVQAFGWACLYSVVATKKNKR